MNKIIRITFLLGLLAGAVWLFNADLAKRHSSLIPREALFGSPKKTNPQISPDGSLISYVAPYQGVLNIWIYDRKTKAERVLTRDKNRGITAYGWVPDGKSILYSQDQGGNENTHLYQLQLSGGTAKDLTPFKNIQARLHSINKHFPDMILIEMNKEDPSRHDLYRLDLKSGALELVAKNTGKVTGWIVDTQMKVRGMVSTRPDAGDDVWIRKDEKSEWQKFFSWSSEDSMTSSVIGFSKSGQELYLIDARGSDTARLVVMDLLKGTLRTLYSDPEYDVGGLSLNSDDYSIETVSIYRMRHDIIPFRENIRVDLEAIQKIEKGDLSVEGGSYDNRYWIISFNSDITPSNYYIYDRKTKSAEFLFASRPELKKYRLAPIKPVKFLARDGLPLRGYLTVPRKGKKPFPLLLVVHGGPWIRDGWGFSPASQWLADRGYICLRVNFRGSTGFGKKFVNAGNKEWGRKMQTDLVDAVNWAVKQGIADPKRVGIIGGSYGGYAVLASAAFFPDVFRCGIDLFGPGDLIALIKAMPPYWDPEKESILLRLGNPATEAAFLKERSPLYHVDRIRIPMLIAQGANDPRVPKVESDKMVQALRAKGLECQYLVFQDEGHGFAKPENRMKFYQAAEAFLAKNLGGKFEQ